MKNDNDRDGVFFDGYCPACKQGKAQIQHTNRPIQRAKCPKCGVRWKILSVNLYYEDSLQKAAELDQQARMIKKKYDFLTFSR